MQSGQHYNLPAKLLWKDCGLYIHQEELSRIKQEILNQPLFIIFDGTTHVCEAFVVVLSYLTDDWELKQCVGRLKVLAKTMTGEEIAQQIIVILSTEFGISSNLIVAAMRDRASVNDVTMRTIKVVNNELLDVGCFSCFWPSLMGLFLLILGEESKPKWE